MNPGHDHERHRGDTVHFSGHDGLDQAAIGEVSRVTWVGVAVNVVLAVCKFAGGFLSGSQSLLADGVHTVSDLATDAAVLIGVRYWTAPADADHPHGHRKIETLVTLGIGVALALVGLGMGYEAVASLTQALSGQGHAPIRGPDAVIWLAMGAAVASIVSKEILYRWTVAKGIRLESSAVIANAWHHRSDAFSSIPPAVVMGGEAAGIHLGRDLWYLDPIGTVVVCVMLLQAAWEVVQPAIGVLLDESADRKLCSAIRKSVTATPGVVGSHRIRTRVIAASAVAVDLHIAVDMNLTVHEGHAIAGDVKHRILRLRVDNGARPVDVMVHVEPADPLEEGLPGGGSSDTMVDWKPK